MSTLLTRSMPGGHAENEDQTDHSHHHGMPHGVAHAGGGGLEEGGGIGAHQLTGDEAGQAVEYPAQDHRIADGDAQRAHQGQPAECAAQLFLSPGGKAVFIGPDGARSGQPADAELGGQAHPAEEKDEEQIGDEEGRAAVLAQAVGEHPDVAQAHGEPTQAMINPKDEPKPPLRWPECEVGSDMIRNLRLVVFGGVPGQPLAGTISIQ